VATRLALEETDDTVTICLPLFLAGEAEEHTFAKEHPTIAVDGCSKHCAYKAIAKHSKEPAAGVDVEALLGEWGAAEPKNRRVLDAEGEATARRIAELLKAKVEAIRGAY
jgi:uncharacterized metal-binding protein